MTSNPYNQIPELGGMERIVHDGPVTWNIGQTGMPFADTSIFDYTNSHRHYDAEFEWMPLEEFKQARYRVYEKFFPWPVEEAYRHNARFLSYSEYWKETFTQLKVDHLIELLSKGTVFDAFAIELDKDGEIMDYQEGRHRALALQQMGIQKVPVWIMHKRF